MTTRAAPVASLAQIALCTSDIPGTIRTFVEVLGFSGAGGRPRWGEGASRIQELESGDDTSLLMWWLVGRQDFVQIELFHHVTPAQRPRRAEWTPSDLGWVRFGVLVPHFDSTLQRLQRAGLTTMTAPISEDGYRRVCLREPGADVIVEIIEDKAMAPSTNGSPLTAPALAYAAVSVSDLEMARLYFNESFGFAEIEADALHQPEHEALWGLEGARRRCAVYLAGEIMLEVVQYETPAPKAPAPGSRLSDQGIMNAAIGYRDQNELDRALTAAKALGASASTAAPTVSGGVYLRILDGLSIELLLVPSELDEVYGFKPRSPGSAGTY